ncbi:MAG: DUF1780 domain-containing protein [Deltaproteobacteria bacterium]|nr:DUF1780 domain-containing protein [Deltaproteobacteria bacterium]
MKESERKYINGLISHTKDSIKFFSNSMKPERERCVCAAFLRCLGIDFSVNGIIAQKPDPPDVIFASAKFEIIELYEDGRRRHDEYRKRLDDLKKAKSMEGALIRIKWPIPISYDKLFTGIKQALNEKAERYGKNLCSSLDVLVYVSLPQRFLDINSDPAKFDEIMAQGWRSVSFVIPPYSHVVYCKENAPTFLSAFSGKTRIEWKAPDTFFEL